MARLAERSESVEQVPEESEAFNGRTIILRSCDVSLKCVAAGTRCWVTFCDLQGAPHFPPTEDAVLARLAYFPAGRALRRCSTHPEKAIFFLGRDLSWGAGAAAQAAKGLSKAGDILCAPKPVVAGKLFL